MRDIYSPLEIDEEWDNFSPTATSAPVAAPETVVPVMPQPDPEPKPNGMSTGSAEPMTDAARDAANQKIKSWFKHDGSAEGKEMPDTRTHTLEISDTGAKPAEATAPPTEPVSVTKVGVVGVDDVATTEPNDTSDAPDPIVLDAAPAADTEEEPVTSTAAPEADDTAEAKPEHAVAWEDGQADSTEEGEAKPHTSETSAIEDVKKELMDRIEDLKKERSGIADSKEAMMNDKEKKTDDFNQEIAAITDGIESADKKIADLDKFIAKLEALK